MPNQYHVQFIQYIFDEDGKEHLILNYRCDLDFAPFIGMMIGFEKPFMEWEYHVEKVLWTTHSEPNFVCQMKEIKYSPTDVNPHWQSVFCFTDIRNYFDKIIEYNKDMENWIAFKLTHYNLKDSKTHWD